jgi:hypothetical protein
MFKAAKSLMNSSVKLSLIGSNATTNADNVRSPQN